MGEVNTRLRSTGSCCLFIPGVAYIRKITVTSAKPQHVQFKQFDSKQKVSQFYQTKTFSTLNQLLLQMKDLPSLPHL